MIPLGLVASGVSASWVFPVEISHGTLYYLRRAGEWPSPTAGFRALPLNQRDQTMGHCVQYGAW